MQTHTFKTLSLFFLLFSIIACSQNSLVGRMYEAQTAASCEETTTGGGMIYSYCSLSFDKNEVTVSSYTKSYEDGYKKHQYPETRKFKYILKDNIVYIKGFTYSKLVVTADALIAKKALIYGEYADLHFTEK